MVPASAGNSRDRGIYWHLASKPKSQRHRCRSDIAVLHGVLALFTPSDREAPRRRSRGSGRESRRSAGNGEIPPQWQEARARLERKVVGPRLMQLRFVENL